jgi:hypothetical protein
MRCPHCGHENKEGRALCAKCSGPLTSGADIKAAPPANSTPFPPLEPEASTPPPTVKRKGLRLPDEPWRAVPAPGVLEPLASSESGAPRLPPRAVPRRMLPSGSRLRKMVRPLGALLALCVLALLAVRANALLYGPLSAQEVLAQVSHRLTSALALSATVEVTTDKGQTVRLAAVEERPDRLTVRMAAGSGAEETLTWDGSNAYQYVPSSGVYVPSSAAMPPGGAAGLAGLSAARLQALARSGQVRKLRARSVDGVRCYALRLGLRPDSLLLLVPVKTPNFVRVKGNLPTVGPFSARLDFDPAPSLLEPLLTLPPTTTSAL